VGPRPRKHPMTGSGEAPPPLTHDQVDKLLAGERKRPRGRWVIRTSFPSGDTAYWGTTRDSAHGLTPYRGSARRYDTEDEARYVAYSHKEAGWIGAFEVEEITRSVPTPRSEPGSGGRALRPSGDPLQHGTASGPVPSGPSRAQTLRLVPSCRTGIAHRPHIDLTCRAAFRTHKTQPSPGVLCTPEAAVPARLRSGTQPPPAASQRPAQPAHNTQTVQAARHHGGTTDSSDRDRGPR
jgi:hypothetical protein